MRVNGGTSRIPHSSPLPKPAVLAGGWRKGVPHTAHWEKGELWSDLGVMLESLHGADMGLGCQPPHPPPVLESQPWTHTGVSWELLAPGASRPFLRSPES